MKFARTLKHRNVPTIIDGIKFHSKKEAARYKELALLLKFGEITNLELQKVYTLIPKQEGERAVKYIADFVYNDGFKTIVEDVKGMCTRDYVIKRKLMLYIHGIRINEM